jgi:hypothetical protein
MAYDVESDANSLYFIVIPVHSDISHLSNETYRRVQFQILHILLQCFHDISQHLHKCADCSIKI